MGSTTAAGDSIALPNYAGPLFVIGNQFQRTPLLTMTGGLTGGRLVGADVFPLGNVVTLNAAASNTVTETASATAPASKYYAPAQQTNFIEVHHTAFDLTYKKMANNQAIGGVAVAGMPLVTSGPEAQRNAHLAQLAIDLEWSMLNGVGTTPATAATDGKMRGVITAGLTSVTVAGGAAQLTKALVDSLITQMLAAGAIFQKPVFMCGAFQVQMLNSLYGFAEQSVSIGGVDLKSIIQPVVGPIGVVYNPVVPTSTLALVDVGVCAPVFMPVPGKPAVFFEPIAKTGAAIKEQLFTMASIDYGAAAYHGGITGLATS